jgi:hypothetical protein
MLKIKKSKKAQFVEVFSWVTLSLITIVGVILLRGCTSAAEQKLAGGDMTDLKTSYDLIAYLRSPITYQGAELTVADLIVMSMENEALKNTMLFAGSWLMPVDPAMVEVAFDQHFSKLSGHPLSIAASNLMRTYNEYVPSAARKAWFCSFKVAARQGISELLLYDSRYSWYEAASCTYEYTIASAKIPDYKGGIITVEIKATVDTTKVKATITSPLLAGILGMY